MAAIHTETHIYMFLIYFIKMHTSIATQFIQFLPKLVECTFNESTYHCIYKRISLNQIRT